METISSWTKVSGTEGPSAIRWASPAMADRSASGSCIFSRSRRMARSSAKTSGSIRQQLSGNYPNRSRSRPERREGIRMSGGALLPPCVDCRGQNVRLVVADHVSAPAHPLHQLLCLEVEMAITNASTGTNVHEIADGVYRINTPVDIVPGGFSFNQYLILDDQPLLFHTGPRKMFPLVREAVESIMPVSHLRFIALSHFEADECGSLNEWLSGAPPSVPLCSQGAA